MCCRYWIGSRPEDARLEKLLSRLEWEYPGAYKTGEIFPGDPAPALIGEAGRLICAPAVFGFPAPRGRGLLLNARAETAAEKPAFAAPMRNGRAILPAEGFFEWSRGERKTKYLFTAEGRGAVYLCGLYKRVGAEIRFVILTCAANASMAEVHDRMPVIAAEDEVRAYLTDPAAARVLLTRAGPPLARREVSG